MKVVILFLLLACTTASCEDLIIGDSANKTLLYSTVVEYNGIPLMRREKNVFYNNPNQEVINSIVVNDRLYSRATAAVTAGGIGFTYFNLLLKSERGKGLEYSIGIYS